ncbi:MAG: ATP-dependent zinc metalloprotease FtsH [Candidatus Ornithospirochaeta sp.]|nr:ATP-dependent zinc metalloprotease FtsH [Sphaerochaetaceae bacterium]MDY5523666.1 ATP-dependent zinc metalloprotease FtsH [Candidatus Ornithospirochaeta sp.]
MEKDNKDNKKPLFYYIYIVVLALLLLNAFVFPLFSGHRVQEVGYSTFLKMVDEGKVKQVVLDDQYILFAAYDDNEKLNTYQTGVFPDQGLIERLEKSGVEFSSYIESEGSPFINFLVSWIVPIIMFSIIGKLLFSFINKRGGNAMSFGKSNAKIYAEKETGVTFKDVEGEDEAKEALEEIVSYLHDNGKYTEIGAKLPKGALLVGPPGTGKTLLARAVAGEANVPFFSISGSEFVEMFVGMGASKVRDLFKQASEKAPCIVFIDEIDTIGKKRDNGGMGTNDEREQTLNQLLTEMDGFDGNKGVVILAATNRPEILDPALLRPGRFDRRIPVNLPDLQGRVAILKVHAKDVKTEDNIDFNSIARATSGASGAELANIINEAALRAVRQGRDKVTQEDLEESVETVIAGYKRKNAVLSQEEKRIVAYHEIGHALVAAKQSGSAPVTKITIIPRTSGSLGYTMQVDSGEKNLMSKEEILTRIATLTGGREAEKLVFNKITTGASNDIKEATKLARSMITQYGMSNQFGMVALETVNNQYLGGDTSLTCSPATSEEIDKEVVKIIGEEARKAGEILKANREKLDELSSFLLEKETITGEEFMAILNK